MINKYNLGFFPTPLHKLDKLSIQYRDYNIYIKRDDQTGLASGGNKTRKLEYLIKDALDRNYNVVFTAGAQQSNHCRQTAAACAIANLECHLILRGIKPKKYQGNLLLSHLLGAKIHFTGTDVKEIKFENYTKKLDQSKKPYIIPYGGSNAIGALGFVHAVKELKEQLLSQKTHVDYIFFASSSGGTQAGLLFGIDFYKLKTKLIPIKIDKNESHAKQIEECVLSIINDIKRNLNIQKEYTTSDITLNKDYNQEAYGVLTKNEISAINKLAKTEGILLDPVYTGRAFYGMLDVLKKKKLPIKSNVLFWHTGGLPAIFDYAESLQ